MRFGEFQGVVRVDGLILRQC